MYRKYSYIGEVKESQTDYNVMSVQNREHRDKLIKKGGILCIKIYADWCEPCKVIAPEYAKMAKQYITENKCICVQENLNNGIAKEYDVTVVPTFLIFFRGYLNQNIQGADLNKIKSVIDSLVNNSNEIHSISNTMKSVSNHEPLYRSNYGQNPHV